MLLLPHVLRCVHSAHHTTHPCQIQPGLSAEKLLGAKLFGKREEWEAEQPSPGAPSLAVMLISFPSDSYTTVSLIAFL